MNNQLLQNFKNWDPEKIARIEDIGKQYGFQDLVPLAIEIKQLFMRAIDVLLSGVPVPESLVVEFETYLTFLSGILGQIGSYNPESDKSSQNSLRISYVNAFRTFCSSVYSGGDISNDINVGKKKNYSLAIINQIESYAQTQNSTANVDLSENSEKVQKLNTLIDQAEKASSALGKASGITAARKLGQFYESEAKANSAMPNGAAKKWLIAGFAFLSFFVIVIIIFGMNPTAPFFVYNRRAI